MVVKDLLIEMPIIVSINKNKLWQKITKFIDENNIKIEDFEETNIKNIYRYDGVYNSVYVYFIKKDGITAFMFFTQDAIIHNGKTYPIIRQKETYNVKRKIKNFTLEIFKEMSKFYQKPILTDNKNSQQMMNVFIKWINDPLKYGIKNYFIYDEKFKKTLSNNSELEHNVWGEFGRAKRYSILFDFFGYLNESNLKESLKLLKGTKAYFEGE